MCGRSKVLRFPDAQAAITDAKRGLFDGFVVQVATENTSDEGGGKVVKLFKQLFADVAAMGPLDVRHFGRVRTQSAEEQLDPRVLDIGEILSQRLQFAEAFSKGVVAVFLKANSGAKYFDGTVGFQDLTSVANLVRDPILLL